MSPVVTQHQATWLLAGLPAATVPQMLLSSPTLEGTLKGIPARLKATSRELLIGLASVICLILAVSILRKQVSSSLPEPYLPSHQDRDGECLQTQKRGSKAGSQKIKQEKCHHSGYTEHNAHMKSQQPTTDKWKIFKNL